MSGAVAVVVVPFEDADAVRLRAEQQAELDARYASLHEGTGDGDTGQAGAEDEGADDDAPGADGEAGEVDDLDPATVVATFLLLEDGRAVGGALLRHSPDHAAGTGSIKRMYVAPDRRGRGLSRVLLAEIEAVARAYGLARLVLETGVRQPESIGLYRSAGYEDTEHFGPWAGGPELICLAKDL